MFQILDTGNPFIWLLLSPNYEHTLLLCCGGCVCVLYAFWHWRYPSLILYISCSSLRISCLSKENGSFYWRIVLETKILPQAVLSIPGRPLLLDPLSWCSKWMCLCTNPCIYKYCHFVQFSSVAQSCPTLCSYMNYCTPGLPVHHQLPECTQTCVHWVGDAIQPSHPLSSPSPPAFNLSQHQGLFKWASSSHQVAKVLEFQLQHQSFQWTPRTDLL